MLLFSKSNDAVLETLIQKIHIFLIKKIDEFPGDVADIFAKSKPLCSTVMNIESFLISEWIQATVLMRSPKKLCIRKTWKNALET